MNCLLSFRSKHKLESHKKVCENKDFCNVILPSEDTKILEFNKYRKSDKEPGEESDANLECLTKNIDGCKSYPEKSSTTKVGEHIPLGSPMSTISSFKKKLKISTMYPDVKIT